MSEGFMNCEKCPVGNKCTYNCFINIGCALSRESKDFRKEIKTVREVFNDIKDGEQYKCINKFYEVQYITRRQNLIAFWNKDKDIFTSGNVINLTQLFIFDKDI